MTTDPYEAELLSAHEKVEFHRRAEQDALEARNAAIVKLNEDGYTAASIAYLLGLSPDAVEKVIRRSRAEP